MKINENNIIPEFSFDDKTINCDDKNMWIRGGGGNYRYYDCESKLSKKRNEWDERLNSDFDCKGVEYNTISVGKLEKVVWDSLFDVLSNSESLKKEKETK